MSAQARVIFHDTIVAYVLREKTRFFPQLRRKKSETPLKEGEEL
jgi:hypothetical protein